MDLAYRGGCEGDRFEREESGAPGGTECGAEDLLFSHTQPFHISHQMRIKHDGSSRDEGSDELGRRPDALKLEEKEKDVLPSANSACNAHYPVLS